MAVSVSLEATPEHVTLARAFATAALRVLEADETEVERIRLVVSELATALVTGDSGSISISVAMDGARCVMSVSGDRALPELGAAARTVVEATVPVERSGGAWVIPLTVGAG